MPTLLNSLPFGNFSRFIVVCRFVAKSAYSISYFRNTIRVANSLYPDQARRSVGPYLDPNRPQKLSADDPSRQIVKQQISFNLDVDSMGVPVVNSVEPAVLSGLHCLLLTLPEYNFRRHSIQIDKC